jgi:NAD(P)-dependent dehydrogenase (short-subunit alcohol dehydrogenase family)
VRAKPRQHAESGSCGETSRNIRRFVRVIMPILVSGAANGLGAAFVEAYRSQEGITVLAIDKRPITPPSENVQTFLVDVASEDSINAFAQEIKDLPIDLVIHSAGIRGLVPALEDEHPDSVPTCETMEAMDVATLTTTLQINTIGTFLLLRAILPNLKAAQEPKVVVMSSRMGSVGNNEVGRKDAGSAYAYRASKAAMNTIVRSFAADVPEVGFILCHPGRVETKLVRCKEEGAISAAESVQSLLPLIERWATEDSGKFYDRFGETIQW